jgi:excisionase family DNA binding protein
MPVPDTGEIEPAHNIDELLVGFKKRVPLKSRTVSVEEAAQLLGISRMGAYRGIWSGDIPHIKIGRRIRVPLAKLNELAPPVDDEPQSDEGEAA